MLNFEISDKERPEWKKSPEVLAKVRTFLYDFYHKYQEPLGMHIARTRKQLKEEDIQFFSHILRKIMDSLTIDKIEACEILIRKDQIDQGSEGIAKLSQSRMDLHCAKSGGLLLYMWEYLWALNGFPTVRLSSKQTASFSVSDLSEDHVKELHLPWDAFSIIPHSDVLPTIKRITVMQIPIPTKEGECGGFVFCAHQTNISELWHSGSSLLELYELQKKPIYDEESMEMETPEKKLLTLCNAVVFTTLAEMLQEKKLVKIENSMMRRRRRKKKSKKKDTPDAKEYRLSTPITIDNVKHVRDYVLGKSSKAYMARWMRRGHFRDQPYGSGRSKVRKKWIEPHMVNRHQKTLLVREHRIKEG